MIAGLTADDEAALNEAFDGPADEAHGTGPLDDFSDDTLTNDPDASGDDGIDGAEFTDEDGEGEGADDDSPAAASNPSGQASPRGAAAQSPELRALEARAQAAEQQAHQAALVLQQLQAAEEQRRADQQYQEFMSSLEDLSPEERETAKLNVVTQYAANILRQQQEAQAETQQRQQFEQAYSASFDFIANGNRLQPNAAGQLVPVKGAAPVLTEAEKELLRYVKTSAQDMQEMADRLVSNRQARTAAARRALAEKRREQGEGQTGGGTGVRTGVPPKAEATSIEDFWNQHDAAYAAPRGARR